MGKCRYDLPEDCNNADCLTCVLDKIRAEIENDWQLKKYPSSPFSCGLRRAIEVIDKYKAEGSEKNAKEAEAFPLCFDVGGHTYGVIGGDEAMKRFREGSEK